LVEQRAQLVEFFRRAQLGRLDDLVELLGEDLVVELVGEFPGVGAGRRQRGLVAGFAGSLLVGLLEVLLGAFGLALVFAVAGRLVFLGVGILVLAFALFGGLVALFAGLRFLVVAVVLGVVAVGV